MLPGCLYTHFSPVNPIVGVITGVNIAVAWFSESRGSGHCGKRSLDLLIQRAPAPCMPSLESSYFLPLICKTVSFPPCANSCHSLDVLESNSLPIMSCVSETPLHTERQDYQENTLSKEKCSTY